MAAECQDASKLPLSLRPDYGISVLQVYQQVARFLLEDKCSLDILTRTRGASGSLTRRQRQYDFIDLPSWVLIGATFVCLTGAFGQVFLGLTIQTLPSPRV